MARVGSASDNPSGVDVNSSWYSDLPSHFLLRSLCGLARGGAKKLARRPCKYYTPQGKAPVRTRRCYAETAFSTGQRIGRVGRFLTRLSGAAVGRRGGTGGTGRMVAACALA